MSKTKKTELPSTDSFDTTGIKKPNPLNVLKSVNDLRDAFDKSIGELSDLIKETNDSKASLVKLLGDQNDLRNALGHLKSELRNYAKQQASHMSAAASKEIKDLESKIMQKLSQGSCDDLRRQITALELIVKDLSKPNFFQRCWSKIKSIF